MIISIIVAIGNNNVIGVKNSLPWKMPADLEYFKKNTLGKIVVMGQKTFQSIGSKPLPKRKHIILTDDKSFTAPENCMIALSIEELFEKTKGEEEIMICGGASIYRQFLPLANRLYLTFIHSDFEGDSFFPEIDFTKFKLIKKEEHDKDEKNPYPYTFTIYERI